jgi:transposase
MGYALADYEWAAIKPKLRGVPRINDRRVLDACVPARANW